MENPGIKTKVIHSFSNSAWNVVGLKLGGKFKIAIVPYIVSENNHVTEINRNEAREHAEFISHCFNHSEFILASSSLGENTKRGGEVMFKVLYYKDQQFWGSSNHITKAEAEAAIAQFYRENPGDWFSAFIE